MQGNNSTAARNSSELYTYKQLFKALSTALYFDEDRKRYHGFTTALIGKALAKETSLNPPAPIFYIGLIHDLGGLGLPNHILHYEVADQNDFKDYPPSEMQQVLRHGPIGANMLSEYGGFEWAESGMRDHHERYDRSGRPEGKSEDELSIEAELLGAAEMLDMFLYLLDRNKKYYGKKERVDRFEDFLKEGGGFRQPIRKKIVDLNAREDFIESLISTKTVEELVDEAIDDLTPPGGVRIDSIVELLGTVIDVKSNYTEDHTSRVANLGLKVGKRLGMPEEALRNYRYAAYLHDIGKVGIDRTILDKPASLTDEEYDKIMEHPRYSEEILAEIDELEEVAKIARQHHERYDGTGYPNGLKGEEILLGARILSVVDAWDAMTFDRPYDDAKDEEEAAAELRDKSGTQFDPQVVETFLALKEKE